MICFVRYLMWKCCRPCSRCIYIEDWHVQPFPSTIFTSPWSTLTHWGRVTHICVSNSTIIASDNGMSPDRRQAIIWTNAGMLQIELLRTNLSEILMEIQTFSFRKNAFEKVVCKTTAILSRPQCVNSSFPGQNGFYHLFTLDVFLCIIANVKFCI